MAAATSSSSSSLALAGLASGINWTNIINDIAAADSAPITLWQDQQTTDNSQNAAYHTIGTDLANLQNDITALSTPSLFQSTTAASSDSSVATAATQTGTPVGTYAFAVTQLATATAQNGSTVGAQPISASDNVANIDLSSSAFADPITGGTFTVNGKTITVAPSDTLQAVFDQISTATGGTVTASYNYATDEITLSSTAPITLGSSTDTSNFLQATQLFTNGAPAVNGAYTVTSLNALAGININAPADDSNLATALTDGGNGQGAFQINGVTINYDSSTDSINDILQSINNSAAGVTATYDGANNRFVLTNNNTGSLGMTMQDVTGNFLAATGLSTGTLQTGTNLQYSLDGSKTLTSTSNTVDASPEGLTGLSITAQGTGATNIAVTPDTSSIATAITTFVNDYNTVQNYISSQTTLSTTTTSTAGATATTSKPGLLTGDIDVENVASNLRQLVDASPLSGLIENLNDIGITSNGNDNTLSTNSLVLNDALANNLGQVTQLFTAPTSGLAASVGSFLKDTLATNGILATKEQNLTSESAGLQTSITNLQSSITSQESELENQFVQMEDAINSINVDKEYLTAYFNSTATTTSAPTAATGGSSSSSGG